MNPGLKILTALTLTALAACSTQQVKQDTTASTPAPAKPVPLPDDAMPLSGQNPPMTVDKNGLTLKLVRIMDGGVCKNELEGAKGVFLVYADTADIERIKREKGAKIFGEFEDKIQTFSSNVLQATVDDMNLAEDPFALGDDEAQEKLADQLADKFHIAAADAINNFQNETSLMLDVRAFPPSFVFFQKGCEVSEIEPESPDAPPPPAE